MEAHDYKLLGKIKRYTQELLKARIIEGLAPRTKAPKEGEVKTVSKNKKPALKQNVKRSKTRAKEKSETTS